MRSSFCRRHLKKSPLLTRLSARWVRAAFRMVNRVDYVAGLGWFNLQDGDPASADSLTTGLMTHTGERKPAFSAYRDAR